MRLRPFVPPEPGPAAHSRRRACGARAAGPLAVTLAAAAATFAGFATFATFATFLVAPLAAQQPALPRLELAALQQAAIERDARAAQHGLLSAATAVRLQSLRDGLKPQFKFAANSTHLSDVTSLPVKIPGAVVPVPPKDPWSGALEVSQLIYDGGATRRGEDLEAAKLAESSSGVDAELEPLRDEVSRTFFALALLQASEREYAVTVNALDAVLVETRARVLQGAALGRDSAAARAEWRLAQGRLAQARASRRAALATLLRLTGVAATDSTPLVLPDWSAALHTLDSVGDPAALRARPEFTRFTKSAERITQEAALSGAENNPRLMAFADGGYGRPGLNQFRTDPEAYWEAGLKVEWTPFTWGSASKARELATLQLRSLDTEARALAEGFARAVQGDLDDRARLRAQLTDDAEVISLREESLAQGEAQRREGVITAAEAIALRSDLTEARLTLDRHRIELAQAEAHIVTTLGLSPR